MYSQEVRRRFAELRAQGHSLRAIAERIQVSKQTLIDWSKQQAQEIHNLTAIQRDAQARELLLDHNSRLAALGTLKRKLLEEVERRDLSTIPTHHLVDKLLEVVEACGDLATEVEFRSTETFSLEDVAKNADDSMHSCTSSWNV